MTRAPAVIIRGDYIAAVPYGKDLHLVSFDNEFTSIPMQEIADVARTADNGTGAAAKGLFVDNRLAPPTLPSSSKVIEYTPRGRGVDIGLRDAFLYDLFISYFNLFVATSAGLFAVPLPRGEVQPRNVRTVLEGPVFAAEPRWGGIAAACGSEGVKLRYHFDGGDSVDARTERISPRGVDDLAWSHRTLVATALDGGIELLRAELGREPEGHYPQARRRYLKQVEILGKDEEVELLHDLASQEIVSLVPFNSLLYAVQRSELAVTLVSRFLAGGSPVERLELPVDGKDVRSIVETDAGIVVEAKDALYCQSPSAWTDLFGGPASRVQAFPRSRRYRRLVVAAVEDGVLLAPVLGRPPLSSLRWWRRDDDYDASNALPPGGGHLH